MPPTRDGRSSDKPEPKEVSVARITSKQAIVVAILSALVSLATLTKDFINPPPTDKDVKEQVDQSLNQRVEKDDGQLVISSSLPVGTVVASLLSPGQFSESVGDPAVFNPEKSRWVLADARNDISRSKLSRIVGKSKTPDLRGMFLRGANDGRSDGLQDPEGDRDPGNYQPDSVKRHSHERPADVWDSGARNGTPVGGGGLGFSYTAPFPRTGEYGESDETRPKNVAVFFYIKVNE